MTPIYYITFCVLMTWMTRQSLALFVSLLKASQAKINAAARAVVIGTPCRLTGVSRIYHVSHIPGLLSAFKSLASRYIFSFLFLLFPTLYLICVQTCACTWMCVPTEAREGIRACGTGVAGGCEHLACVSATKLSSSERAASGLNPWPIIADPRHVFSCFEFPTALLSTA